MQIGKKPKPEAVQGNTSDDTDPSLTEAPSATEPAKVVAGRGSQFVEALLTERENYERRGLDDRVAAVDEQLAIYGAGSSNTADSTPLTTR